MPRIAVGLVMSLADSIVANELKTINKNLLSPASLAVHDGSFGPLSVSVFMASVYFMGLVSVEGSTFTSRLSPEIIPPVIFLTFVGSVTSRTVISDGSVKPDTLRLVVPVNFLTG